MSIKRQRYVAVCEYEYGVWVHVLKVLGAPVEDLKSGFSDEISRDR